MKRCVSEQFIKYYDLKYPSMINNIPFRRLFMYLCFGTLKDDQTAKLRIPYLHLAHLAKRRKEASNRNFIAIIFLRSFKNEVLNNLEWTEPQMSSNYEYGRCRTISNDGLDDQDRVMIANELEFKGEKFFFDTGKRSNRKNITDEKKEYYLEYLEDSKCFNLNPTQQKIMDGLSVISLSGKAFSKKLRDNRSAIEAAIDLLESEPDDVYPIEVKKQNQRKILASIEEDPRIFYRPTPLGRSPRLHASYESMLSLKSPVRKAFSKGWLEADLVSSQFIILAALLDAPIAKNYIRQMNSGWNLWTYLNESSGGSGKPNKKDKDTFKQLIYGCCFGMSKTKTFKDLELAGKGDLISNDLVVELFGRRSEWFKKIGEHGWITDVWGTKHYPEPAGRKKDIYGNLVFAKERWVGSLAATKIQSIEMEIISSVFDCAAKYHNTYDFEIIAFLHDGLLISSRDKKYLDVIQSRLNKYVMDAANTVGNSIGIDLSAVKLEFSLL